MSSRNCPNCGAPYEIDKVKCPYCGTLTLDLAGLNLEENTPIFIRYKVPFDKERGCMSYWGKDSAYITQKAIPHIETINFENDYTDICDSKGIIVKKILNNRNVSTILKFDAVAMPETGELYKITIVED